MSEQVQYIAVLNNDQFLGGLNKIASAGNATWSKLNQQQDQFQKEVNDSSAGMDRMNTKMKNLKSSGDMLGGMFSTLFAGLSIFSLFQLGKSSLQEFDSQAKANAQTMAALASTNNLAGQSLEGISKQATKLSLQSLFTDDQIQSAQNLMLTFTKVRGEVYQQSIPLLLDMSQAMGTDLKSSAIQLGKALNDPITGMQALRRVGVTFTEDQKAMVEQLVSSGRLEEAQALILRELTTEFGGSAAAAAKAGMGPLQLYNKRLGEIKESAGGLISQALNSLMPAFNGFAGVLEKVVGWIGRNQELVGFLAVYLGSFVAAILLVVGAIKIWTGVQWLLNAAMTANPIGAIIVAVVALVGIIIYAWNKFEGFRGFLVGLWESFKAVFTNLKELAMNVLGGIGDLLIGIFTFDKEKITAGLDRLKGGFQEYGKQVGESFKEGYADGVAMKAGDVAGATPAINGAGGGGGDNGAVPPGADPTASNIGSFSGTENRKTINIQIGSLVQKLEFNATNVQAGIDDMKEQIQRVLLSVVNNANMIAG